MDVSKVIQNIKISLPMTYRNYLLCFLVTYRTIGNRKFDITSTIKNFTDRSKIHSKEWAGHGRFNRVMPNTPSVVGQGASDHLHDKNLIVVVPDITFQIANNVTLMVATVAFGMGLDKSDVRALQDQEVASCNLRSKGLCLVPTMFRFVCWRYSSFKQLSLPLQLSHRPSNMQDGHNGTVMAYGHTGTGKTYTLGRLGDKDTSARGIMVRAMEDVFAEISLETDSICHIYSIYYWLIHKYLETICYQVSKASRTGSTPLAGLSVQQQSSKQNIKRPTEVSNHVKWCNTSCCPLVQQESPKLNKKACCKLS
ncbi:armadillo repeat-containing kinesin-like protein 3 [Artemisia annua]|uniref:Armadillo repeat-containing kinesin-like protein 3 n=1 Tax=Artemisia annua TaxID=35608 RepID=A0A2U1NV29_ARTAN|nr:armadillo repeat-containing kinesin-like protein 3 [Artemisia annua]